MKRKSVERAALVASLISLGVSIVECADARFAAWEARADFEMKAASAETCWTEYAKGDEQ